MTGFATERLRASPLVATDLEFFERLWGDDRVGKTLGGVRDVAQVSEVVAAGLQHWQQHGFGRWVLRVEQQQVGTVKLAVWHGLGRPEVELGYALLPDFWGRGYATEAGAGALDYATESLKLTEVVAFALADNCSSLAVMQRLGFSGDERILLAGREHALRRRRLQP